MGGAHTWGPHFTSGTLAAHHCLIYVSHEPHEMSIITLARKRQRLQRTELAQSPMESKLNTLILEKRRTFLEGVPRKPEEEQLKSQEQLRSLLSAC